MTLSFPRSQFETPTEPIAMTVAVEQDFTDYLALVDGDKAAAAILTLAAALDHMNAEIR